MEIAINKPKTTALALEIESYKPKMTTLVLEVPALALDLILILLIKKKMFQESTPYIGDCAVAYIRNYSPI